MTHQEIKELAGHRAVSPWIMKLVGDAVAKEREALTPRCWTTEMNDAWNKAIPDLTLAFDELIRARGKT